MFRIASAAVLIASAVSLVSAQAYVSFDLDATVEPTFADPLEGLLFVDGSPDTGRANCNAIDNCLGVICETSGCILLGYNADGATTLTSTGYNTVSWRFNTPEGPSCALFVDDFTTSSGNCQCTELEVQDTAFGCRARSAASQLPQINLRKRLAADHVRKAYYERRRAAVGGPFA